MKQLRLFFWNCGRILDGREKVAASSAFGPYLDGQFLPSLPHDFCILGLSPNGLQQRGALPQQVSPARRGGGGGRAGVWGHCAVLWRGPCWDGPHALLLPVRACVTLCGFPFVWSAAPNPLSTA